MSGGDHWTLFTALNSDNKQHQKIQIFLKQIDYNELCQTSLSIRHALQPELDSSLTCSVNLHDFAHGRYHVVLQLLFSDGKRWIARVRMHDQTSDDAHEENAMANEIATIKFIRSKTTIPVPEVFGFDISSPSKNPVRARYLFMEELSGQILNKSLASSVPENFQTKVALQFADYYYQLSTLRFDAIGAAQPSRSQREEEPSSTSGLYDSNNSPANSKLTVREGIATSLEFFYIERHKCNQEALSQKSQSEDIAAAAWFLEQAVPSMILPQHLHGPFPICHTDLHYNNILFDKDYNITGVLDWSDLSTGPIELFAANPEFMTYPGLSDEENLPIRRFARIVAAEVKSLASKSNDELGMALAGLIGSARAELVYRCICTWPWRTQVDAKQTLRLLYGKSAKWENFKAMHESSQIRSEKADEL